MPTFKLDEEEEEKFFNFKGDSDMFFRQWRAPSMLPIFEKKKDREFIEAENRYSDAEAKKLKRQKEHSEKFNRKMEALQIELEKKAAISPPKESLFRRPTQQEKESVQKAWKLEYESPSSTAKMTTARQIPLRPRATPIVGIKKESLLLQKPSGSLKNLDFLKNVTPKSMETPNNNSFLNNSQDAVFFTQENRSFNLDNYNGARPSFAFEFQGATSTPVSKNCPKFSVGSQISEDTEINDSKYVTAVESPAGNEKTASSLKLFDLRNEENERKKNEEKAKAEAEKIEKDRKEKEEKIKIQEQEKQNLRIKEEKAKAEAEKNRIDLQEIERRNKIPDQEIQNFKTKKEQAETEMLVNCQKKKEEEHLKITNEEKEVEKIQNESTSNEATKVFEAFINIYETILKKKKAFEKSADLNRRSLLKRTINEQITVFTKKETDENERNRITTFFKNLLGKKAVEGFSGINSTVELKISDEEEVFYAIYCILEKYLNLIELDDELISSVSYFISVLSVSHKTLENVFVSLIINRSTVLRQRRNECIKMFAESKLSADEYAIMNNKEKALVSLFLNVFAKNVLFSNAGKTMKLNEEMLWKYSEAVLDQAGNVPRAGLILESLVTVCKSGLLKNTKRWKRFTEKLKTEIFPQMEENSYFECDYSVVERLRRVLETNQLL